MPYREGHQTERIGWPSCGAESRHERLKRSSPYGMGESPER